jgi:hypothetical protein
MQARARKIADANMRIDGSPVSSARRVADIDRDLGRLFAHDLLGRPLATLPDHKRFGISLNQNCA